MSPVTRVRPVLVIPDFARRANCPAVRSSTVAMPSWVGSLTGAPVGAFTGALTGAFTGADEGSGVEKSDGDVVGASVSS
jgi:hypothetical protein